MTDYLKQLEQELSQSHAYPSDRVTLDNCDREPIHLIGRVQSHGVLVASRLVNSAPERVDYLSENAATLLGLDVQALLGQPLDHLLPAHAVDMLMSTARSATHNAQTPLQLELLTSNSEVREMSCHIHQDVLFVEIQPLALAATSSTSFYSDDVMVVADFTHQLLGCSTLDDLATTMTEFFRRALGYDRVMVYRFDEDEHGEVIAESKRDDLESFLGLHYPASDIPRFARFLYVQNRCRMIVDINAEGSPILAADDSQATEVLDLRYSNLRSMSPIHVEYLANMGITASLTMSLVRDGQLYGMVIMHHYEPLFCDLRSRQLINQLSRVCSDYIGVLERLEESALVERSQDVRNLINVYLFDDLKNTDFKGVSESVRRLLHAEGVLVYLNGEKVYWNGLLYPDVERFEELAAAAEMDQPQVYHSEHLAHDSPGLYELEPRISGLMLINIPSDKRSFIAVFRCEKAELVTWAGRKDEYLPSRDGRLHARKSFATWREYTRNRSLSWSHADQLHAREIRSSLIRYLLRLNETNLARLVSFDTLTGLPNRNFICNQIQAHLANGDAIALLLIDCDRFKHINDSLGHDVGDRVLSEVGRRLSDLESGNVRAGRLGGDEFVMLARCPGRTEAAALAARLVDAFRQPITFDHYTFHVPASVGVALSDHHATMSSLMRAADMAMYEAKQDGGNRYRFISERSLVKADERLKIEQNLYEAVARREMYNHYQPIIDTREKRVVAIEALCRWRNADNEIIEPARFLSVAEQTGIIIPLGIELARQALAALVELQRSYPRISLWLNFSPLQILNEQLVDFLIAEAARLDLDNRHICIEITEESYFEDVADMIRRIEQFKQAGFRVAIDDFGSGYSSLSYLNSLPVDAVKLDKSLIDQIEHSQRARDLMIVCQQMAEVCGLVSIAEGVETAGQDRLLEQVGIDRLQGGYFSMPLPLEDLQDWLVQHSVPPELS